jgi:hypothetical protein
VEWGAPGQTHGFEIGRIHAALGEIMTVAHGLELGPRDVVVDGQRHRRR